MLELARDSRQLSASHICLEARSDIVLAAASDRRPFHRATDEGPTGCQPAIADVVRDKFGLAQMVMVGDRGMITSARIAALNQAGDGTQRPDADAYGWITALRAPAIRKLTADDGPLQLSLFDQQDLAEITAPDFPG